MGAVSAPDAATSAAPLEPRLRELLGGVAALRLLVLAWAVAVAVIDARSGVLSERTPAIALLAIAIGWTGVVAMSALTMPHRLTNPVTMVVDVTVAASLAAADWFVYDGPHPQSFGSAWPATSVALVGIVVGWRGGLVSGLVVGCANLIAAATSGRVEGRGLALMGSVVLLATIGAVTGWVSHRLRSAESEVAAARERERFARTLHDGVLQSLAVIQRRSDDAALVELARNQEWELRDFIGAGPPERADLVSELRTVAARIERLHRQRVELVVIEVPATRPDELDAIVGAAAEAATNAAKHSAATRVTICVDIGEDASGALVTVVDDGCGFDVDATQPGTGLSRSIHGRLDEVGGRATVRSTPGRGTEVALWVP